MGKQLRTTPITLTEEQERFFIETWENNPNDTARMILHDKLGMAADVVWYIAKKLREENKLRNKRLNRYSQQDAIAFKNEYECGRSLNEIAKAHHVGIKGVKKYLKELYGGEIPIIQGKLDGEEWRDVEGFGRYQVSNKGRIYVKTIHRIIYGSDVHGYRNVKLLDEKNKYHTVAIHKLVAQAFIPNPENKPQVDHIDSNPQNNNVTNLRWVTKEEQYENENTKKKMQLAQERLQKGWKINPLIKKMLEIEPDKLELIKMIINYN